MISTQPSKLAGLLAAEEEKLLACVHCGLCLEACPTYVHTGDENDSPRGRIYLMRAVEEGRLASDSKAFDRHINRCLGCRACEQACPAGVEYGQLLEAARARLSGVEKRRGWRERLMRLVLRRVWLSPARLRAALACARLVRDMKLARLLRQLKIASLLSPKLDFALALLESSAPAQLVRDGKLVQDKGEAGTRVVEYEVEPEVGRDGSARALLFKGCVMEGLFARVNGSIARVLEANDCATHAPGAQVCCGALHAHAGDLKGARELARRNIDAFEDEAGTPIVTNAGGCGAMLAAYAHLLADDTEYAARALEFSARVRDISQQLEMTGILEGASLDDCVTTYDASCHLIYGQRAVDAPLRMLRAIPGLKYVPLEGSEVCCGGAGIYNLLQPELSSRVLKEKLKHVEETGAQLLATANPGCHMQIGAGARLAGLALKLCHPVELLDESYRRAGLYESPESGVKNSRL
ncbi:MAG TPA: heterodisulfide reductase-related iron-sulfur binding cluster [Pyrinomonadaceae bacterium]|jgi:glycolate oxidase iron-sulfur subunit|nr:heterodisulfide reductase-related iron-sulfur binding cluster [Pyrinomonadaceae bacterium]